LGPFFFFLSVLFVCLFCPYVEKNRADQKSQKKKTKNNVFIRYSLFFFLSLFF
jgi:hypothetical protein